MGNEKVVSSAAHYGRVPETILFDAEIGPEACQLYAYLTTCDYGRAGKAWPGRETAAKRLGWSLRSVDRWLSHLEQRGAIQRHQAGAGRPMVIELLADVTALPDMAAPASPHRVDSLATSRKRTPSITREERETGFASLLPITCGVPGCQSGWITTDEGESRRCGCAA